MERVDKIENELSHFLRSLIDISSKIFIDEEGVQQAQLRLLIDVSIVAFVCFSFQKVLIYDPSLRI